VEKLKPRVYVGIKWGLQGPTVLLAARHDPAPHDHVQVIREVFQEGMLLETAVGIAKEWQRELGVRKFYCDPTQPAFIKIMRKQRLCAVPVEAKEVSLAINLVKKRLANFKLGAPVSLYFDTIPGRRDGAGAFACPNLMAEFGRFRGREQKLNRPVKDAPLEMDNFALSALHYILLGIATEVTPRVRWI
jgi:hypothetical protein